MGTLYWQLNDCWPVCSWAAIDSGGRPKPLWYATRKFFSPRLLTIQPEGEQFATGDDLWLNVINDSADQWTGTAHVRLVDFINGSLPTHETFEIDCAPRSVQKVKLPGDRFHAPQNPSRTLLLAEFDEHRATWFFDVDKHLHYPPGELTSTLSREGETHRLTIIAKTLVRDLSIFIDRLDPDATINDQLVTLLPGESVTFEIRSKQTLTIEQLTSVPVLQCVNQFGREG